MSYIEPCCCDRQLPRLLKEQGTAFFQTNGDVLVKHFMKSLGCMVDNGCAMWLSIAKVDAGLLSMVRQWFGRGWIKELHLLTTGTGQEDDEMNMVSEELSEFLEAVEYLRVEPMGCDMMLFSDGRKAVAIYGPMLSDTAPGMKIYSAYFGAADGEKVKERMDAVRALAKARAKRLKKRNENKLASGQETVPETYAPDETQAEE